MLQICTFSKCINVNMRRCVFGRGLCFIHALMASLSACCGQLGKLISIDACVHKFSYSRGTQPQWIILLPSCTVIKPWLPSFAIDLEPSWHMAPKTEKDSKKEQSCKTKQKHLQTPSKQGCHRTQQNIRSPCVKRQQVKKCKRSGKSVKAMMQKNSNFKSV